MALREHSEHRPVPPSVYEKFLRAAWIQQGRPVEVNIQSKHVTHLSSQRIDSEQKWVNGTVSELIDRYPKFVRVDVSVWPMRCSRPFVVTCKIRDPRKPDKIVRSSNIHYPLWVRPSAKLLFQQTLSSGKSIWRQGEILCFADGKYINYCSFQDPMRTSPEYDYGSQTWVNRHQATHVNRKKIKRKHIIHEAITDPNTFIEKFDRLEPFSFITNEANHVILGWVMMPLDICRILISYMPKYRSIELFPATPLSANTFYWIGRKFEFEGEVFNRLVLRSMEIHVSPDRSGLSPDLELQFSITPFRRHQLGQGEKKCSWTHDDGRFVFEWGHEYEDAWVISPGRYKFQIKAQHKKKFEVSMQKNRPRILSREGSFTVEPYFYNVICDHGWFPQIRFFADAG